MKNPKRVKAGLKGYQAVIERLGKAEFHKRGGLATHKMEMFTAPDGSVGIEAYKRYHPNEFKGKKHRYGAASLEVDF